ncbi:MAG: DUF3108 domain-containing protein [Bacteroidales bacterium]|jgi:hypothetical protein|nr:DUF3108 domain-containing protein [Bacteroidales bacterium]
MKKILLLTAFTIFSLSVFAQSNSLPFKAGEKIEVTLNYKWGISADIAVLNFNLQEVTESGTPCFHIVLNARTNKFFDSFYKVRDIYESKFEMDMDPVYAMRSVHEGGFNAFNEYKWSADKKTLYARVEKSTMATPVDTVFKSSETIRDVINLIYSIRTSDIKALKAGKRTSMLVAMDRNVTRATLSYVRNETRQVDGIGKFNTVCLAMNLKRVSDVDQVETKLAVPTGDDIKNTVYIWLTDDDNRLPVYISVPISVGKLEIRTTSMENVKYPLTSKVK